MTRPKSLRWIIPGHWAILRGGRVDGVWNTISEAVGAMTDEVEVVAACVGGNLPQDIAEVRLRGVIWREILP